MAVEMKSATPNERLDITMSNSTDGLGGAAIDLAAVPNLNDLNCARSIIDAVDNAKLTLSNAKSPFSAR